MLTRPPVAGSRAIRAVLLGGATAGALDIAYAMILAVQRGRPATRPLQTVASGLLGSAAYDGGAATVALGLALHFVIATGAALVYYLASRRIAVLRERPLLAGALFGILVYLFMNFVVIPLSAVPFKPSYPPSALAMGFASHVLLVGLPIALAIRRVWRPR